MHPELFRIFGYPIHTYGVTAASGFLAGFFFSRWQARKTGQDPEIAADVVFYGIVFGVLGSRLLYVAINWSEYFSTHLLDIIRIDKGGLVWYGGPILCAPVIWWILSRKGISFPAFADIVMPGAILGLGFGRLGCLAAGCCYGRPSDVPWAITYPPNSAPDITYHGASLHPAPLYELSACLLIVGMAVWWNQRKKVHGETFFLTVVAYAVARSIIETFRGDKVRGFVAGEWLSTSQFISLFVGVACVALWVYFRKHPTERMRLDYHSALEHLDEDDEGGTDAEREERRRARRRRRAKAGA